MTLWLAMEGNPFLNGAGEYVLNQGNAEHHNRNRWQQLTRHGHRLTRVARDEDFRNPLASVDGPGWLNGNIVGKKVLCLAAGGGRQGPLYAAAGGIVTVVDFCEELLAQDREVARQRNLQLTTVNTSMVHMPMLADSSFDVVIHPVSTCYVAHVEPVFREIARVTRPGGIYISQHKQPTSLQGCLRPDESGRWFIEFPNDFHQPLPQVGFDNLVREPGMSEFAHSWQVLIGGICRSGFVIEDLMEPPHGDRTAASGSFADRSRFLNPYVRIKARRRETTLPQKSGLLLNE